MVTADAVPCEVGDRATQFTAAAPPRYLWCPASQLPEGVVYRPDRDATILACRILREIFDPAYLTRAKFRLG